jgi:phage tail tape-measure protein
MATLVLGAAGAGIGGSIGGSILGVSAATIGGMIGSSVGAVVDSWIVSSLAPGQRFEGPRLASLRITSSTEGAVIPPHSGRMPRATRSPAESTVPTKHSWPKRNPKAFPSRKPP